MKKCILTTSLFVASLAISPQASEIFGNARQYALGGAYSAMAQGAEAMFSNPANLYLNHNRKFSMNILGIGAEVANNSISHVTYQRYVGDYLDEKEIDYILGEIPEEGVSLRSDAKLQAFSIGYGPVAIGIRGFSSYSSLFARELFELAFRGNEINRVYKFDPVKGDGLTVAAAGLALGHSFYFENSVVKNFGFGVNFRYLYGLSYTRVTESRFFAQTTYSSLDGDGSIKAEYSEGGVGYGVTVGTTVALYNDFRLAVVIENLHSTMDWDKRSRELSFTFDVNEERIESLLQANGTVDSLFLTQDTSIAVDKFTISLPSVLRLGMMLPLQAKRWYLNTEYEQGFDDAEFFAFKPRLALGVEFLPNNVFRFRIGASFGGNYENHYSGGMGLAFDRFCWDIAFRTYGGITSWASKGFGVATSIAIRY
ncbi:hypothetical protein JXA02_01965 [candidate division KSB1 bacterium]|nr:hypothetical protein [candidate division KSB1 bacterium]RQW10498.1 MAG: hypothetical protein EH222_02160 [candidate division KSB1 bacterium]